MRGDPRALLRETRARDRKRCRQRIEPAQAIPGVAPAAQVVFGFRQIDLEEERAGGVRVPRRERARQLERAAIVAAGDSSVDRRVEAFLRVAPAHGLAASFASSGGQRNPTVRRHANQLPRKSLGGQTSPSLKTDDAKSPVGLPSASWQAGKRWLASQMRFQRDAPY